MALSVIALVGSGCWIVGPIALAAVAIVLAHGALARCFNRFNCRFAVLWRHVQLLCGLGGLHEGVAVCRQRDTGPLFHSSGFLFHVHGFVARLAQQCYLCLDFAARLSEFARQRGTASAFLFERLAMLHYAPRQISSHGGGLLRDGGRFVALLFERLYALRGFCPQLLELGTPGLGQLLRQSLGRLLR